MNDRYSNFVVACLCCAFAAFSPLAFANEVRVGVSPTTGYYEVTSKTFDSPKGATVSPSRAVSPVVTPLSGGGFQQSMGGGITIEGLKKPAPFTARAAAGLQTMKNGAKKLARSNPARFAAGVGFTVFLDSLDWLITDSSKIVKKDSSLPSDVYNGVPPDYRYTLNMGGGYFFGSCSNASPSDVCVSSTVVDSQSDRYLNETCPSNNRGDPLTGFSGSVLSGGKCYYGGSVGYNNPPPIVDVSSSELDSSIDSFYSPHPSDFVLLTPYMPPDFILVDPILPVETDLGITNTYDSTGALIGTEQKTSTTEFTISNNSTSKPSISSSTSVKTETFKDGQSQGSTVTETTQPAIVGGGGSKVEIPTVEIPTDCDFHPTLCKWLDWTKEEPEEPDDNLSNLLKEVPISTKTFTISGGAAACPAPIVLNLSQFGSREVSYQPFCDLASKMKFLYLALMSFAAAVLLHRSINRV